MADFTDSQAAVARQKWRAAAGIWLQVRWRRNHLRRHRNVSRKTGVMGSYRRQQIQISIHTAKTAASHKTEGDMPLTKKFLETTQQHEV